MRDGIRRGLVVLLGISFLATACSDTEPSTATAPPTDSQGSTAAPPSSTPAPTTATTTPASTTTLPTERELPTSAAEMTKELSAAEAAVRDAGLSQLLQADWGRRQQRLYRHLAVNDQWADEVIGGAEPSVAGAVALNWEARRELSSLVTSGKLSTKLPAWRVRDPLPIDELLTYYAEGEAATGIEWEYLAAINLVETRMGRIEGLSTAGATGPMQFLPSTWEECCEGDPRVDRDAIIGAATYLRDRGGPDDMTKALRGYNNSGYYVAAVSAYAEVLRTDPAAYSGYHAWEVFFRADAGLVRIPTGYDEPEAVDAAQWIAENPQHLVG